MSGRIVLAVALACACVAVSGCNTTEGFGKDMEAGGKAIKNSAADHND